MTTPITAEAILARWRLVFMGVIVLLVGGVKAYELTHNRGYQPTQPIAFSHKLHAGDLGMDCLYCHTGAIKSRHATIPSVESCMGCHSVIRATRPEIQKLAEHYANNEPIPWVQVHSLPDHAYFNHAAHVTAGVSCQTCHGPIQEMEVVKQFVDMSMGWCMTCHRSDEFVRTPERLAVAREQNEYAHSYFRTGGPAPVDRAALRREYADASGPIWDGEDLNRITRDYDVEQVSNLIAESLGYDGLARQEGRRGQTRIIDHITAFQNASISCNVCHQ